MNNYVTENEVVHAEVVYLHYQRDADPKWDGYLAQKEMDGISVI